MAPEQGEKNNADWPVPSGSLFFTGLRAFRKSAGRVINPSCRFSEYVLFWE
jgi:hypothetical protein